MSARQMWLNAVGAARAAAERAEATERRFEAVARVHAEEEWQRRWDAAPAAVQAQMSRDRYRACLQVYGRPWRRPHEGWRLD